MIETHVSLTQQAEEALQEIAQQTGKSQTALIQEAIQQFIQLHQQKAAELKLEQRRSIIRQAYGLWAERNDLPDFEELRRSWDCSLSENLRIIGKD